MQRQIRLLLSAIKEICEEIDRGVEITMRERPWLDEPTLEGRDIHELPDERQDHRIRMAILIRKISSLLPMQKERAQEVLF